MEEWLPFEAIAASLQPRATTKSVTRASDEKDNFHAKLLWNKTKNLRFNKRCQCNVPKRYTENNMVIAILVLLIPRPF